MAEGLRVVVEPRTVAVTPGEPFVLGLEVYNASTIIDGYGVSILGLDQQWVAAEPTVLSLFPDTAGTMTLTVTLPVGFPAGQHTLGVLVASAIHDEASALEEILITVAAMEDAEINLEPAAITAGSKGRFGVGVFNRGNQPVQFSLSGEDPESRLAFKFRPEVIEVPPGEQVWAQGLASGRRPFFGSPEARVMTIQAVGDGEPIEAVGTFLQKPLIPRWVLTLLSILLALAVWAFILMYGINRVVGDDAAAGTETGQDGAAGGADGAGGAGGEAAVGVISGKATALGLDPPFVAGVTVDALSIGDGSEIVASAETGDDGTYLLEGLPTDSYKVRFTSPGYRTIWYAGAETFQSASSVAVDGDEVAGISVEMVGEPGTVAGAFVGDPADPTATVTIVGLQDLQGDPPQPFTDTGTFSGEYEFGGVPTPGNYEVTITKAGFATVVIPIVLGPGEVQRAPDSTLLGLNGSVTGIVSDADGPLGGVMVVVSGPIEATTTSLTDGAVGTYELTELATPGRYTLTFTKDGYKPATLAVTLVAGGSAPGTDVLMETADAAVSGTVRDPNGTLGGVTVTATKGDLAVTTTSVTAGAAKGTYSVTGLASGTYSVVFSKTGYLSETLSVTLKESQKLEGVDVTLAVDPGPASISGTTTDADGNSLLGGVTVSVSDGTKVVTAKTATTGAVGTYTVPNLAAGTYTLTFSLEGFRSATTNVTLTSGQKRTGVNAALRSVGSRPIFGTVSDRNGPLGGKTVTVTGSRFGPNGELIPIEPVSAVTVSSGSAKGSYEFTALPTPGSYTVSVNVATYLPVSENISLASDASREVNFVIEGADGSVTGSVEGPDPFFSEGPFVEGVTVSLSGPAGPNGAPFSATTTTAGGSFSFSGLPTPGGYTLSFSSTYYQPKTSTFTLTPSEGSGSPKVLPPVTLVLYPKGSIGGSLVGNDPFANPPGNGPVPGVTVIATLQANPSVTGSAVTNSQGLYTITGLTTPGTYKVTFSSSRWAGVSYTQTLTPGQEYVRPTPTTMDIQVGKIQGTVTCSAGSPIPGAPFANVLAAARRGGTPVGSGVLTNGSGLYQIFDVPGGTTYAVQFTAPGGSPQGTSSPEQSLGKGTTITIDFSLLCPG